jgi:(R,R)-butanediol dehydrogenase/meso-butanediol dehydrogenase/diacetyl reductase
MSASSVPGSTGVEVGHPVHPRRRNRRQRRDLGHEAAVAMNDLVFNEISLVGSLAYADHPATIEMIASGKVDPFQFITGRIQLEDIVARGFDELINNKEENVKILVGP